MSDREWVITGGLALLWLLWRHQPEVKPVELPGGYGEFSYVAYTDEGIPFAVVAPPEPVLMPIPELRF